MSTNLAVDQVGENQAAKEVVINTATGQLDAALTEQLTISLASSSATLTDTQYRRAMRLYASGVTASGRTVTLPAIKKFSIVTADGTNTHSIDVIRGSTTLTVGAGSTALIYTDGTTNGLTVVSVNSSRPYDVGTFVAGMPDASEVILRYNYPRAVAWAAGMTGSRVTAGVAATAQTDFLVKINGSTVGTIRFAAAGTVATYVSFSAVNIVANDIMSITAPALPDATLADISFTLAGVQS